MGYIMTPADMDAVLERLEKDYIIYAPVVYKDGGRFSDTDCVRYGKINSIEEIEFEKKSEFSFKEILTPVSQTLFFFTENEVKEADAEKKGAVVFLRNCDLHAVRRLDEMYLNNGPEDYYYKRIREKIHFVVMGCAKSFENCFCVDMGTNKADYETSIDAKEDGYYLDCKWEELRKYLDAAVENENAQSRQAENRPENVTSRTAEVTPEYVTENYVHVNIPENLSSEIGKSSLWREYDSRCINCGRCNFACPTCTCFTMQDIFYTDNGKVGERRRVWASCMVDGYTDVAGGGSYRQKNGERMRFKVLHKVLDFKQRNGYPMCVGCGRCDDICPEYISFSNIINKLEDGMKEVEGDE